MKLEDNVKFLDKEKEDNDKNKTILTNLYDRGIIDAEGNLI